MTEILIIYLLALVILSFITRLLKYTSYRWFFILLHAIWLTFLTVSCSNNYPLFLSEEAAGLNLLELIRPMKVKNFGEEFIEKNNLFLVDVSQDIQTIPVPSKDADPTQKAQVIATDRKKLLNFLRFLKDSTQNKIDLIVCDVLLDYQLDNQLDSTLGSILRELSDTHKLILAESFQDGIRFPAEDGHFDPRKLNTGLINISLHNGQFFNYTLIPVKGKQSLAYRMYTHLYDVQSEVLTIPGFGNWLDEEVKSRGIGTITYNRTLNTFIPALFLKESDLQPKIAPQTKTLTKGTTIQEPNSWIDFIKDEVISHSEERTGLRTINNFIKYYKMGLPSTTELLPTLIDSSRKPTIVFIGVFDDPQRDVHQTAYGSMHGSLITLNVFINLVYRANSFSLSYMIFLFFMFCLVSWQMISKKITYRKDKISDLFNNIISLFITAFYLTLIPLKNWLNSFRRNKIPEDSRDRENYQTISINEIINSEEQTPQMKWKEWRQNFKSVRKSFINFIIVNLQKGLHRLYRAFQVIILEESPYWTLLILLAVSAFCFNHIVNIMGLVIYVAAVEFSLKVLTYRPRV